VHGTVPMTPTAQNLRFSNRVASVGGANVSRQRFYGNAPAAVARRTPFVQQQNNVRTAVTGGQRQAPAGRSPATRNPNWSRFQSRPAPSQSAPRASERPDRFGGAPVRQARPAPAPAPVQRAPRSDRAESEQRRAQPAPAPSRNEPRRLQVSPRILRERPQQSPPSYSAPRQQAPRAPMRNGGGGGAQRGGRGGGPAGGHGRR
jgi:hypothetical protein